jgi:uncharacterized cupin superfamily protein
MRVRREGGTSGGVRTGWLLAGLLCAVSLPAIAEEDTGAEKKAAPAPVRLDRERIAGLELTEYDPMSKESVLEGSAKHRGHVFFSGEEIVVEVWEAGPAKLSVKEPFPYDEYVFIQSGKLILTDAKGKKTEYVEGDSLVVPQGFIGTWEMLGNYRELVVIEKEAYERAEAVE